MVNIIKKNKELFILIGSILAIAICIEVPSWIKGGYYIGGGDIKTQSYPFFVLCRNETLNAIKNKTFPFYSWSLFLGNNIWASKSSYGMYDVFNIMFYFCDKNYFWIYNLQIIIKLLVAGITFYLYIVYIFKDKKIGLFGSLLYVSSSYLLYFTSQTEFLSYLAFVPLYFLGIEHHLKSNKNILFIISTTVLFLTNYYLFFTLTLFSPVYFIYRYYNINNSLKGIFRATLIMIFYYLIGMLISAIAIVPTLLYITQSERVGDLPKSLLFFEDAKMYFHALCALFVPSDLYIYGNNVFNYSEHTLKELCLFSSYLTPVVLPQLFINKNKKLKKSSIIVYIIILMVLLIPVLSGIVNDFSGPGYRWTYIAIIFNIFIVCQILFVDNYVSNKLLLLSFIFESIIIIFSFFGTIYFTGYDIKDYYPQLSIMCISILCIGLYTLFFSKKKIICILLVIEIVIHSLLLGYKNIDSMVPKQDSISIETVLSDEYSETIKDYLNSLDQNNIHSFYRTYVSYDSIYWQFSRNMNLIYNLEGLMVYDSSASPSYIDMSKITKKGFICDIDWEMSVTDPDLLDFLSCKYALTISEDEIPFKEYRIIENSYRGGIIVSENLNYEPICVSYTKFSNDIPNSFSVLKENVISNDASIKEYIHSKNSSNIENVNYFGNHLDGTMTSDDKGFAILKLSYDEGFRIKVNDNNVPIYKCNGGVIGFPIEKGINNINVDFVPKGFKAGAILSMCGVILFGIVIFLQVKKTN